MRQVSDLVPPRRRQLERVKRRIQGDADLLKNAPPSRKEREELLRRKVIEVMCEEGIVCTGRELQETVSILVEEMLGLGPLEPLLREERITEIMINGPGQAFVEIDGRIREIELGFRSEDQVFHLIDRIVAPLGLRVDESSPFVDARLTDGSRVNVIIPPLSLKGPVITIRKFSSSPLTLEKMVEAGNLSAGLADFLSRGIEHRLNILISGGTGSGKTTLLNALSRHIPRGERIITIEDAAELRLQQPHVIPLEARPPNLEGKGEVTVRDLLRNALRMRPDRIIVGEVRGGEALDMLQAMNTGHEGSLSTIHANSPQEGLLRLETMVTMANAGLPHSSIAAQIALSLDLVVHLARGADGVRRIVEVSCLGGSHPPGGRHFPVGRYALETLFRLEPAVGGKPTQIRPLVDEGRLEEVLERRSLGRISLVEE